MSQSKLAEALGMMGKSWGSAGVERGHAVTSVWQNLTPTRLDVGVSIPQRRPFESVRAYRSSIGAGSEDIRAGSADGIERTATGSD
jgi:hypothetical protein